MAISLGIYPTFSDKPIYHGTLLSVPLGCFFGLKTNRLVVFDLGLTCDTATTTTTTTRTTTTTTTNMKQSLPTKIPSPVPVDLLILSSRGSSMRLLAFCTSASLLQSGLSVPQTYSLWQKIAILSVAFPWRIHGAAIYMLTWIPSRLTPVMLALIYQHHGSVMGFLWENFNWKHKWCLFTTCCHGVPFSVRKTSTSSNLHPILGFFSGTSKGSLNGYPLVN